MDQKKNLEEKLEANEEIDIDDLEKFLKDTQANREIQNVAYENLVEENGFWKNRCKQLQTSVDDLELKLKDDREIISKLKTQNNELMLINNRRKTKIDQLAFSKKTLQEEFEIHQQDHQQQNDITLKKRKANEEELQIWKDKSIEITRKIKRLKETLDEIK